MIEELDEFYVKKKIIKYEEMKKYVRGNRILKNAVEKTRKIPYNIRD